MARSYSATASAEIAYSPSTVPKSWTMLSISSAITVSAPAARSGSASEM